MSFLLTKAVLTVITGGCARVIAVSKKLQLDKISFFMAEVFSLIPGPLRLEERGYLRDGIIVFLEFYLKPCAHLPANGNRKSLPAGSRYSIIPGESL